MSAYKSFAVFGAGRLGSAILAALAAQNAPVIHLSRSGSSKTVPPGVTVVQVDYTDAAAVAAVFREHKVDVVLATVGMEATGVQKLLADAAKLIEVKLFLPAAYGIPTEGHLGPGFVAKNDIVGYLKNIGIPSTVIHVNGIFIEYIPMIAGCSDGKIRIVGDGEAPISFTSIADIVGFVAHALTTLPESELENHIMRLEGGSTGWDEASQRKGCGRDAAGAANALWPGHQWQSIKEVHNL
ncbi:hypothetical protein DFH08DRAFT_925516 [Mycena albidolilacea]|uniref:NmrA-like domain-containing protein n=1 Tax=Mycena albidolilacea TaxID=1033008 RepID=A0AAD6ZT31_9AGAR|nr:hypothetical protein DFH08DRAFT_925516 [Mycena albidolilacea]